MKVSIAAREDIVRLVLEKKQRPTTVARMKKVSRQYIYQLFHKYNKTGSVTDLPRQGRKKVSTEAQNLKLIRRSRGNPFSTAPELQKRWIQDRVTTSLSTVKQSLRMNELNAKVARKVPLISKKTSHQKPSMGQKTPKMECCQMESCHLF